MKHTDIELFITVLCTGSDIVQLPIVVIALNEFVIFSIISVLTIPTAYERHCN